MTTSLESDTFAGFPNSALGTVVPNIFFSRVLPQVESTEELVVSLYFFFAQGLRPRRPRFATRREMEADGTLALSLARLCGGHDGEALGRGLAAAVERGTLTRAAAPAGDGEEELYVVNTPSNRRALERLAASGVRVEEPLPPADGSAAPNIFVLYEQNIGSITPLIAEDLKEAEERYKPEWIREAFRDAVSLNKRSWRYIERILQRWETEGPDYEEPGRDTEAEWLARRYAAGKRRPGGHATARD